MCTARARIILFLAALLATFGGACRAHPVTQSALRVHVDPGSVRLHATISTEEFLVGAFHLGVAQADDPERLAAYGRYLARHLTVQADGALLHGHVMAAPAALRAPLVFQIDYPLPQPLQRLRLSQDVLREFDYTPGNPWEASYVVDWTPAPSPASPHPLTATAPLLLDCTGHPLALCIPAPTSDGLFLAFVKEGLHHILSGYDHLLFVLALLFSVRRLGGLVAVVTVFTLAHTLTLGLASAGYVPGAPSVVEPLIAASIVVMALHNLRGERQRIGANLAIAFGFGLFHGLGFAGGLAEAMSAHAAAALLPALAGFGIGVELGHQLVVLPTFAAWALCRRYATPTVSERWVPRTGSALIGVAGMAYFLMAMSAR
ncbi:HupE/UreJ family protein [Tahibacter amnicola]|uniref:HupE/UreJ family protein n=1 Tax=Tahibacter amnicola TaxID=2976241 RepID=A0ABY6BGJ2_9GAMM|nr:HupE/UreJ family protein [Tahibacter amnicola]UXI68984.1 HupE/UreJ family protein [Tahibacter amnicola]